MICPFCLKEWKLKILKNIRNLKQELNHGLVLKNVHKFIKFNQKDLLKSYVDIYTEFRKIAKVILKKTFSNLLNNSVFAKVFKNVRKNRNIKLITTKTRRKYLVPEPN